ncbi:MAG: FeoB-associated Cys-rich membrane protein [Bacteroidales bacterium]|nr:FeoB-associated Cys-rich membrane protein [Bacteroidales bacterium]
MSETTNAIIQHVAVGVVMAIIVFIAGYKVYNWYKRRDLDEGCGGRCGSCGCH